MSIDDEDDGPQRDFSELLPVVVAVFLTLAAIGVCFISINRPEKPATPAVRSGELVIGIGKGQTIHPKPQPYIPDPGVGPIDPDTGKPQ
jgi:hypothetical protein